MAYQQYPQNYPQEGMNNQPLLNNNMAAPYLPPSQGYPQYPAGAQFVQPTIQVQVQIPVGRENLEGLPLKPIGRLPQRFYCPVCRRPEVSTVQYKMGLGGWVWCLLCVPGISCGPCCIESCQDAIHECPECRREVTKDPFCC